ncbi:predicted protein [Nematostella vectensis]|uniref:G-protein coupled receptors family 1 profile domain-containing protein n=1 Tax=Nematostella vectensis TaxID=45351 RepID=A7SKY5_NEMVE|nr:predicted protein [Nematostella vectensis]|eukprot:XP_001627742.1 predicted protein [Nematostella vectensis]
MSLEIRVFGCIFLVFIFFVGLIGNLLVCSVVRSRTVRSSATNHILLNLAIADILGCLVNLPIMFVTFYVDFQNNFLESLSDAHFVLTVTTGFPVCLCHLLLSVDRYDAIVNPFHRRVTVPRMKRVSIVLWGVSLGAGLIAAVLVVIIPTHWLILHDDSPHFIAGEVLNGVGTAVILSILTVMLYSFVKVRTSFRVHNTHMVQALGQAKVDKEMRLTKVAVLLIASFTVTCLPWVFMRLVYSITGHQDKAAYILSYCLLYLSHAINPLLYTSLMRQFKRVMYHKIHCCFRRLSCREPDLHDSPLSENSREPTEGVVSRGRQRLSLAVVHPFCPQKGVKKDSEISLEKVGTNTENIEIES